MSLRGLGLDPTDHEVGVGETGGVSVTMKNSKLRHGQICISTKLSWEPYKMDLKIDQRQENQGVQDPGFFLLCPVFHLPNHVASMVSAGSKCLEKALSESLGFVGIYFAWWAPIPLSDGNISNSFLGDNHYPTFNLSCQGRLTTTQGSRNWYLTLFQLTNISYNVTGSVMTYDPGQANGTLLLTWIFLLLLLCESHIWLKTIVAIEKFLINTP